MNNKETGGINYEEYTKNFREGVQFFKNENKKFEVKRYVEKPIIGVVNLHEWKERPKRIEVLRKGIKDKKLTIADALIDTVRTKKKNNESAESTREKINKVHEFFGMDDNTNVIKLAESAEEVVTKMEQELHSLEVGTSLEEEKGSNTIKEYGNLQALIEDLKGQNVLDQSEEKGRIFKNIIVVGGTKRELEGMLLEKGINLNLLPALHSIESRQQLEETINSTIEKKEE